MMSTLTGVALVALLAAACTTSSTTAPQGPATPAPATGAATPTSAALIERGVLGLRVEPEASRVGYDRELFVHWIDADGDGCDTRQEVLRRESTTPPQIDPFGCAVVAGDWVSYLDAATTEQPGDLDVDHTVALAEAWDSGSWAWDPQTREAFANDLSTPGALRAVSAGANRSKGDRDPGEYRPPDPAAHCAFATAWVAVKQAWDLSVDATEEVALVEMLATC